jgi:hypothetical protein
VVVATQWGRIQVAPTKLQIMKFLPKLGSERKIFLNLHSVHIIVQGFCDAELSTTLIEVFNFLAAMAVIKIKTRKLHVHCSHLYPHKAGKLRSSPSDVLLDKLSIQGRPTDISERWERYWFNDTRSEKHVVESWDEHTPEEAWFRSTDKHMSIGSVGRS